MSDLAIGGMGFGVLFLLIALRVPIGVAMIAVGHGRLRRDRRHRAAAELSQDRDVLAVQLVRLLGHPAVPDDGQFRRPAPASPRRCSAPPAPSSAIFRGGLAMAAIGGCAAFGTISGSSLATAAMMGQVSLPELRRYKYSGLVRHRHARRRRHARRADPAVDPADHLRDHGGGKHRPAVPGRLRARRAGRHRLHDRHRHRGAHRPGGRARPAPRRPRPSAGGAARRLDGAC